jgi:collagenase-like PrtC family protease
MNAMDGKLILPTNWDPEYLAKILPFKPAYLYGSLPQERTLRTYTLLQEIGPEDAAGHISTARNNGTGFTYVMNATCLGNEELTEEGRAKIMERFQWLAEQDITAIVTANPFILELIKTHFPMLEAHVSVLAFVDNPRKAMFYRDMGADVIHLDPHVNRNLRTLEAIRNSVDCRLSVLVNEGCLFSCPMRHYHSNVMSHSYESVQGKSYIDYCYHKCSYVRNIQPEEIMRTPWIRPEDMHYFLDVGIDYFKVAGREKMGDGFKTSNDALYFMAQAYYNRKVDNVWDLLIGQQEILPMFGGDADTSAKQSPVRIDSSKLDGFFEYFKQGRCDLDCKHCKYCGVWAKKAITVQGDNQAYANRLASDIEIFRQGSYRTGAS